LDEGKMTPWKRVGNYLGMSMAQSNPRKAIKRADKPLGNLPLEILTYLSCYIEEANANGTLKSPIVYGQISKSSPNPPLSFLLGCAVKILGVWMG
jgi:hypothetical protein